MSQPNILIFMVDQLNGTLFPDGPAEWLHAPNLKALASRSTRFANTYTASPLCAPGRAAFIRPGVIRPSSATGELSHEERQDAFGAGLTRAAGMLRWGRRTEPLGVSDAELPPCDQTALELLDEAIRNTS